MRKKNDLTEQQLVDDFRMGSEKAFAILFRQFYPALCFYAIGFTDDQAVAEDIVEEIFIMVWNKREKFNHFKVLRSFLYSSVRNACLNWIKQKARHAKHEKRIADFTDISESSHLEKLVRAEVFRDVNTAFEKLPPKCRKIISMIFFEGKKVREVAEELNLSIGTVKTQKARGLMLLRNRLTILLLLISLMA
ncbi:MAG TPA: RNA polymerase sigma-70 factor [Puia sp.]|jgi:RNA polymerase sigma-70 factor (ECF subfamily)|nr:RNA polymerase sigma-70 factor [Puia sp.]